MGQTLCNWHVYLWIVDSNLFGFLWCLWVGTGCAFVMDRSVYAVVLKCFRVGINRHHKDPSFTWICACQFCSFKQGTSGEGSSNAFITLNFFVSSLNLFSIVHTQENSRRMIIICKIMKALKSAKAVGQWKTDCLTVSYGSMATLAFVTIRISEFHVDFV